MIASGASMSSCLDALTAAIGRLAPEAHACALVTDGTRSGPTGRRSHQAYASCVSPALAAALQDQLGDEALQGAVTAVIQHGRPSTCPDIAAAAAWPAPWRSLCLDHQVLAGHAHPALNAAGRTVGALFLGFSVARAPSDWERQVAQFGALAISTVIERDRTAVHLLDEVNALARLQALSAELVGPGELEPLLQKILAAAADISGTDKGNIQIYDPTTRHLRIAVHQGLGTRLVAHFLEDGWDASCGEAAKQVQRLVVQDVEQLEALHGTLGLEIVREDGIRSIQCTPLISRDGRLLGMLNNHYRQPGGPTPEALRYIDLLARQAAELIERSQTEAQLAQERQHKDEFLAMLAHELRNPLAPLHHMLEVQKRSEGDWALTRKARDVMERQVLQLVRLVDDLLDVNRINRGKLALRMQQLSLHTVVQQAIEVCRPALEQRGHRLHVSLPQAPLTVRGDPARLTQVFGNLLTNAVKYTPTGGDLELRVDASPDGVAVRVRDNGSGIPADQLDKIFDMFTQVDRTLERAQGGLGIGLMLVKRLVEMHGGTVRVHSEGLGRGSEFIVNLPLADAHEGAPLALDASTAVASRRILVVDDNQDAAQSLASLLTLEGHEARMAYDGAQALEIGHRMRPDVVLMDIGMPGMSGHEVCRRIRRLDWGRHVTLIALTGWGQDEDRRQSEQAGFDAHLVKPVNLAALQALLAGPA
ncbi:hybrid sensor histidine kinase/response regulator [Comamonas serinivorans]|uniref:histidine kinase n=2 Tax=Comamonas serinivorans TaxID=1082851 RepID=A0A1Y0ETM8_9BURK|nr:hybrid sensor histidine kinase/response regulator [Comamonas serinivorans]